MKTTNRLNVFFEPIGEANSWELAIRRGEVGRSPRALTQHVRRIPVPAFLRPAGKDAAPAAAPATLHHRSRRLHTANRNRDHLAS